MIERFNVSESLSKIADFSVLDCKIDTEKLIDGNFVAEFFDEFFGSFFFFCSSFTLNAKNPLVKKFDSYNKLMASNLKSQLDVMKATYNPIENYSMTEKGKKTNTGTQGNKQTGNARSESTSNIYAYNVSTSNPASSSVATSNPNLENVRTDNLTEINELTRSGNVGVTTSAEMIEENIKLWVWKFFDTVFKDIDRVLTIGVYEV